MSEQKRFVNQTLNSNDYKKVEDGADMVKGVIGIACVLATSGAVIKKYGPKVIKGIKTLIIK